MAWNSPDIIKSVFENYGYTPTDAEVAALAPAFGEGMGAGSISAVGNYVTAHQQVKGAQSLIQGNLQAETAGAKTAQGLAGQYESQAGATADTATGQYQKALQTLQSAPQLFGSMTPDQIGQYLAPLQSQFNYGLGQVQGAAGQRGIAGSSLEAQAMAQAQQQYQQSVLSQGLGIGITSQQNQANLLQALGGQQFGQAGQLYGQAQQQYGLAPQYMGLANQSAQQNVGVSEDLAQLPGQSVSQAMAQQATLQAMNPQQSNPWGGIIGTALGAGLGAFGGPMGAGLGANLGGQIGSAATGNPMGAQLGGSLGNTAMLAGLLGKGGFPSWGSTFGGGGGVGGNPPTYTSGLNQSPGQFAMNSPLPNGYGSNPGSSLMSDPMLSLS